jgi:HD-GYP domain-containing protein (c-di-GMP phosphodiesterase class II)
VFAEGTTLETLDNVDSRRFLPHAIAATALVIVVPAVAVIQLSPLSGIPDILVSALLATGLSVMAGSICSTLWTGRSASREIPFGDLMLWAWARRVRAERRLARAGESIATDADAASELVALRRLSVVFEAREGLTHGHSGRVARHAERIARRMGVPDDQVERIEAAAAVHDLGLVRVPRAILAKGDDLTLDERGLVECHAVTGAEQVAAVADAETAAIVRHHHERYDGGGYPDGLAGAEIPLGARIVAVADAFDELVSAAPGVAPMSRRNALDALSSRGGRELDPDVVATFAAYYSGTRAIAAVAVAATAPQRMVRWLAAAPAGIGSAGAPAVLQGVCAAGALALAGSCLTVLPAIRPDGEDAKPAAQSSPRAAGSAVGAGGDLASAGNRPDGGTGADRGAGTDGRAPLPVAGPEQDTGRGDGGDQGGGAGESPSTGGGGAASPREGETERLRASRRNRPRSRRRRSSCRTFPTPPTCRATRPRSCSTPCSTVSARRCRRPSRSPTRSRASSAG